MSLGGNDVLDDYPTEGNQVFFRIARDLAIVLSTLSEAKPNTLFLLGSYDILNFEKSFLCRSLALVVFGTTDAFTINSYFVLGADLIEIVASLDSRWLPLDVVGALQGRPGDPDLNAWSPAYLITPDCIHLTPTGYEIFNDALFRKLHSLLDTR